MPQIVYDSLVVLGVFMLIGVVVAFVGWMREIFIRRAEAKDIERERIKTIFSKTKDIQDNINLLQYKLDKIQKHIETWVKE